MNKTVHGVYLWLTSHRQIFEKVIFPILLFIYPYTGVFRGIDVSDTTYALGGFQFPDRMQQMWQLSTYLHHLTGRFLMHLPFGDTMLGMNIWSTLFISMTAIVTYYLLHFLIPAWMIFVGEWIAVSLCWCPHVILYNYMTYMFFTFGLLFLIKGLTGEQHKKKWFLAAGIMLGLNTMVRLPNVIECAAVLLVIYYAVLTGDQVSNCLRSIGVCIGGYCIGFLIPFTMICLQYGTDAYAQMITTLIDMTQTASQYSGAGMLTLILQAYGGTIAKMAIMLPCIAAGVVMFSILPEKYLALKRAIYIAGLMLLTAYFFIRRVLTLNYWYYDSIFQIAMMFIIFSLIFYIVDLIGLLNGSRPERLMSAAALFMVLILPIGSNNYTYPVLNCLFLIAPVSMGVFRRVFRAACGVWSESVFQKKKASIGRYFQNEDDMRHRSRFFRQHFTWASMTVVVLMLLIVQGTLFHLTFVFRDGTVSDGTGPCRMDTLTTIPKLRGMHTTAYNAKQLDALYAFIADHQLTNQEVILFGDIPGLSYILDLEPAIFSTWPDLDSVKTQDFDEALMALTGEPLVIVKGDGTNYEYAERKYNLLFFFMQEHSYDKIYDDGTYRMYAGTD